MLKFPISKEEFLSPSSKYRALPFWGLNGELKKDELERQIDTFKKMGYGGFYMHARAGLVTPYLTDEFMELIKACCEKAKEENMIAGLYDEDRYPSGVAGGMVTRNPDFTRRYLRFTPYKNGCAPAGKVFRGFPRLENGKLLAIYKIELDERGYLKGFTRLKEDTEGENIRYAYLEAQAATTDKQQTYVDCLNPKAIQEFARITYDRYKEKVGEFFGNVSPSIFTDEPQYAGQVCLNFALDADDAILPWTNDIPETFLSAYGYDIIDHIPELIYDRIDTLSKARLNYHDHIAERFAAAFSDTLGNWCRQNGIDFTGHIMSEGSLEGQTMRSGEAMRCYRAYDIPGIDVLGKVVLEYPTAKQAQSAVRQQGSKGMLSELYGVSGYDFEFRDYKLQGDWQAALGVTLRVPHHAWYTMAGNAKRDYPASISYQAPWHEKYRLIEDHFARVNLAMTRGKSRVKVGVIHPIESMWINFGAGDTSGGIRSQLESDFNALINTLTENLIDFDFISEARLPDLCPEGSFPLKVGEMEYTHIIVPELSTIRKTTLDRLCAFSKLGGSLVFIGSCPDYVDGEKSDSALSLYNAAAHAGSAGARLIGMIDSARDIDIRLPDGVRAKHITYQMRDEGDSKWLFLATTRFMGSPDADMPNQGIKFNVGQYYGPQVLKFELNGVYDIEVLDTLTGNISALPVSHILGKTVFERMWYMHDSLLLRLTEHTGEPEAFVYTAPSFAEISRLDGEFPVSLSEDNVLLLDIAECSGIKDEILKLDGRLRAERGMPARGFFGKQPYQIKREPPMEHVKLSFAIKSETVVPSPKLALEHSETCRVFLNGASVPSNKIGWYTDRSIDVIALPEIMEGENELTVEVPFGLCDQLEAMYLLGDFGVKLLGGSAVITNPVRSLAFGDWTKQGLPFFGGNVTYRIPAPEGAFTLRIPHFRGALISVSDSTGRFIGDIAFSPYALPIPEDHSSDLLVTVYGSRGNAFGPLHHLSSIPYQQGPDSWRSTGDLFNYEHSPSPKGILSAPRVCR